MAIDLCDLSMVKGFIGIEQEDTQADAVLQSLITSVSKQIERYLDRYVEATSYTEYFSVESGQTVFYVHAYPVTAVTSVKNDLDWQWASTSAVSADYVNYVAHSGIIHVYGKVLVAGYGALQIVYTGGMAANTEAIYGGDYADIALAAQEQVIALWRNRATFGIMSSSQGGGSVSYGTVKLLDSVKELLDPHRRRPYV